MLNESIRKLLQNKNSRMSELESLLSSPQTASDPDLYRNYSKEHSSLQELCSEYREYVKFEKDIEGLKELNNSDDPELKIIVQSELSELAQKIEKLENKLRLKLIPSDPNENKNVIVEIRAGTGGDEAALFAGDLFRMYCRYAESKRWAVELIEKNSTGIGGFKEVIFEINGKGVWGRFKFEKGIHRVQRVPQTEASGRVHTSAVTVAVLAEAEEIEIDVRTEDLRIDTYRASGAGGQYINKTDSAIRITHIPTGIVVACQEERSQIKNRARAFQVLRAKLFEQKQEAQALEKSADRRKQVGSGDRSEKIRTYNFPQNRITDHRIDFSLHKLADILEGNMDELIDKLSSNEQEENLKNAEYGIK